MVAYVKKTLFLSLLLLLMPGLAGQAYADGLELVAVKTDAEPVLDGVGNEEMWSTATPVIVHDAIADIDITLKAAHNTAKIFILASFADPDENRQHRTLLWDKKLNAYQNGPEREDTFVIKWSMTSYPTKLTLTENVPYVADIWFWKAMRTDHAGYADDKTHIYRTSKSKNAKTLISENGQIFYLTRDGDAGEAAYETNLVPGFQGDRLPKYTQRQPTESRADIRAKGAWQDGRWTLEFSRKLATGHDDDIEFQLDGRYPFAVSRHEVAGRHPEPGSQQPLYGTGEVGEIIHLLFAQ
ncbi:MAG: hypothetical protein KKD73_08385 [Proteobacteria bacterium]|nr:hypothetical protein [Pseudomonadota bacterium]MBU1638869.1 hypothetical protein [Pseudomonadota bacterium]